MSSAEFVTIGSLFVELTPAMYGESLSSAHQYTLVAGGAAANVVFALARLGVPVRFLTAVGDDAFGTLLIDELTSFGVDTSVVRRAEGELTPVTFSAIDRQGGKAFSFYRFPGWCSPMETLTDEDFARITNSRLFDFSEGSIREASLRSRVFRAAGEARRNGATILYAVNLRKRSWHLPDAEIQAIQRQAVALADIVVLNEEEVFFITGHDAEAGLRELQQYGPRVVVMTRGGEGDVAVRVGDDMTAIPPYRVSVIYDVGAGDTFHAGLVAAALRYKDFTAMTIDQWADAARFAAATAAIRVSTSADPHDLPTYTQVQAWMAEQ